MELDHDPFMALWLPRLTALIRLGTIAAGRLLGAQLGSAAAGFLRVFIRPRDDDCQLWIRRTFLLFGHTAYKVGDKLYDSDAVFLNGSIKPHLITVINDPQEADDGRWWKIGCEVSSLFVPPLPAYEGESAEYGIFWTCHWATAIVMTQLPLSGTLVQWLILGLAILQASIALGLAFALDFLTGNAEQTTYQWLSLLPLFGNAQPRRPRDTPVNVFDQESDSDLGDEEEEDPQVEMSFIDAQQHIVAGHADDNIRVPRQVRRADTPMKIMLHRAGLMDDEIEPAIARLTTMRAYPAASALLTRESILLGEAPSAQYPPDEWLATYSTQVDEVDLDLVYLNHHLIQQPHMDLPPSFGYLVRPDGTLLFPNMTAASVPPRALAPTGFIAYLVAEGATLAMDGIDPIHVAGHVSLAAEMMGVPVVAFVRTNAVSTSEFASRRLVLFQTVGNVYDSPFVPLVYEGNGSYMTASVLTGGLPIPGSSHSLFDRRYAPRIPAVAEALAPEGFDAVVDRWHVAVHDFHSRDHVKRFLATRINRTVRASKSVVW